MLVLFKTLSCMRLFFSGLIISHSCFFFSFIDTSTTEIYTLSLHDALPICSGFGCIACLGTCLTDRSVQMAGLPAHRCPSRRRSESGNHSPDREPRRTACRLGA